MLKNKISVDRCLLCFVHLFLHKCTFIIGKLYLFFSCYLFYRLNTRSDKLISQQKATGFLLGSVDLSRLNLQQSVWFSGKVEPM
ncbi:hypothetical protein B0W48_04750 [Pseudoalteromonas aliena]|uniref:Uncharacterized protein n=1 Tax=Pseudoalteromonas aliena TaxID=247523 RepID=A0A1Q2GVM4_9GAMM|nr:hypothetical protein B0W48_04750 [Pseudoalteromonas aliena]